MEKYLRPQTLFGNKFEAYLNQINIKKKDEARINSAAYLYLTEEK